MGLKLLATIPVASFSTMMSSLASQLATLYTAGYKHQKMILVWNRQLYPQSLDYRFQYWASDRTMIHHIGVAGDLGIATNIFIQATGITTSNAEPTFTDQPLYIYYI